jgi:uncharacterized protein
MGAAVLRYCRQPWLVMENTVPNRCFAVLLLASLSLSATPASGAGRAPEAVTAPPLAAQIMPPAEPPPVDLAQLPEALRGLRLDALITRLSETELLQRCGEVVPLARERAEAEPQRPGPALLLAICAYADGNAEAAAAHFTRMRENVTAAAPPGVWPGDRYYYAVGSADVAAILLAAGGDDEAAGPIAEAIEVSPDGYRLFNVLWQREGSGRVQRYRVDVTPNAERLINYLAGSARVPDQPQAARDSAAAMAGYMAVQLSARVLAAPAEALAARGVIAERTGYFGGSEQARQDLERAAAQDNVIGRYRYAEWLLARPAPDAMQRLRAQENLRLAAAAHLPEAQVLLVLACEAQLFDCSREELRGWRAASVTAYGKVEVALLRYTALSQLPQLGGADKAAQALQQAVKAGSAQAQLLRAQQLQRDAAGTDARRQREIDKLLRSAAAQDFAAAVDMQTWLLREQATTPQQQAQVLAGFRRAAELGSPGAPVELGNAYARGQGVDKDMVQAARWYRLAAERGDPAGQFNYATALKEGKGVDVDAAAARRWYMRAALQGHAQSYAALGDIHAHGEDVPPSAENASLFYSSAAALGDMRGQFLYAIRLRDGTGIARDEAAAAKWFEKAALQGHVMAGIALAQAMIRGHGLAADPEAGIARLQSCATLGETACALALAGELGSGPPAVQDLPRALGLLEQAAAHNNAIALNNLGWAYENGRGTTVDEARAYAAYARCEALQEPEDGLAECLNNLGRVLRDGLGTPRDAARAAALFRRAYSLGSAWAGCNLGAVLREGDGVEADAAQAATLVAEAAGRNIVECQLQHARALLRAGTAPAAEALQWLRKAADAGYWPAQEEIVKVLLREKSPLRDDKAGLEYAETCAAAGNPTCLGEAGAQLFWRDAAEAKIRGRALLERAAEAGDRRAAMRLGLAAYHGSGEPRDLPAARRWLQLAGPYEFAPGRLARLLQKDGDSAAARALLLEQAGNGNALARFQAIGACAAADCGANAPSNASWLAKAEADGEDFARNLLNNIAWAVATDPLAPREDAHRLIQLMQAARYGLRDEWTHHDTLAAVLARAGESKQACTEQQRVISMARQAKASAASLARLEQRRAAYCSGKTWDLLD